MTAILSVEPLSDEEQAELARCEEIVDRGRSTWLEVGEALATIRNRRLHRETHPSWRAYVHDRFGFGRSWANRLIDAVVATEELTAAGFAPDELPTTPHAAVALGPLLPPAPTASANGGAPRSAAFASPDALATAWAAARARAEAARGPGAAPTTAETTAAVDDVVPLRPKKSPPPPPPVDGLAPEVVDRRARRLIDRFGRPEAVAVARRIIDLVGAYDL